MRRSIALPTARLAVLSGRFGLSQTLAGLTLSRLPWISATLALLLYAATMARNLTWINHGGDGGELITASMTLGIAHPPGYPLYIIIGRLFGLLPVGTVAGRYTLLSALAGAAAIGLAVHCMIMHRPSVQTHYKRAPGLPALAVGLALALTPLLWGQAVIVEVYTFSLFFVTLFVWSVLARRSPIVVGLAFGLAVSAHLTGLLLLPLALWRARSGLFRFTLGVLLGLTSLLLLPLLATSKSPVLWGSLDTISDWWWLVSGRLYSANVLGLRPSMWPHRLAAWLNPGALLPVLLWLAVAIRSAWRNRARASTVTAALLATAALYFIYAFTYRPDDAVVLLLPTILLLAILAGRELPEQLGRSMWLLPVVMLTFAIVSYPPEKGESLRLYALTRLNQVPENALVLTPGDATISALWYFHHVENVRPDIIIVDENLFQFIWYRKRVARDYSDLWVPAADDLVSFEVHNWLRRPVCKLALTGRKEITCLLPDSLGVPLG